MENMALSKYNGEKMNPREVCSFLSFEDLVSSSGCQNLPNPWLNRIVILCKDESGKVGLRVQTLRKGVFVSLVTPGSPSAMAGLRFGDQILALGRKSVAGWDREKVHSALKSEPVNYIIMAIRDRPLSRGLVLQKDGAGTLGMKIENGIITGIGINTSAAKNGVLINQQLIEINGSCTVGLSDKMIRTWISDCGETVAVTLMDIAIFRALIRDMSPWLLENQMNHSSCQ
ncbi:syntenin-1 [Eurytemora carolleeae]|uniref:syntenin-1 n=1 Tax=Eurytemora carolleeae TaxID=1294199 RepID=UPI000C7593E7|nr:syntenin-1 [Eurytemora carolleeae]|eukprot:XP_023323632.1 syntenin-1-like [Eurytemora affinis]